MIVARCDVERRPRWAPLLALPALLCSAGLGLACLSSPLLRWAVFSFGW